MGAPSLGRVLLDYSPGHLASSHHQKTQVFVHGGVATAFAGGIDVEPLRLDGPPHTVPQTPWHDAAMRTRGDAARALLDNFTTRWTEAATLTPSTYDIGRGSTPYNPTTLVPYAPPTPRSSLGRPAPTTSVQVPRSFPDAKEFGVFRNTPWATLPRSGVHEIVRTFQPGDRRRAAVHRHPAPGVRARPSTIRSPRSSVPCNKGSRSSP